MTAQVRLRLAVKGSEGILQHYISALRSKAASTGRTVLSWAPILHAVPRPDRPQGLSAVVRVKDEETWLPVSIRSIATVADEIIVGDNGSTDRTPEILTELQKELQDRLTVLRQPDLDIKDLTNVLIERTRFRWLIRWDADFVARTDGPNSVSYLRNWLFNQDPRRYASVYPRMIELCGDLFHQRPETASRADCHCFTYSDQLRYVYGWSGYESPKVPRWYRVLQYDIPTFFHVDVKPARRMFLSSLWKCYLTDPQRAHYPTFACYLHKQLTEHWRTSDLDEAVTLWAQAAFTHLVPYDSDRFGDYPTLLKPFLDHPRYRLRYSNGQIVGREVLYHHAASSPTTPPHISLSTATHSTHATIKQIYDQQPIAERYTHTRFSRPLGALQHRIQVQTINEAIRRYNSRSVLEIAAGPARLTADILGFETAIAVDSSHAMLSIAKRVVPQSQPWTLVQADAFHLPFTRHFDLIYTFRFIRHFTLPDRQKLYLTVRDLLNDKGIFIFDALHYHKSPIITYYEQKGTIHIYDEIYSTPSRLISELAQEGFEVVELTPVIQHFYIQAAISRISYLLNLSPFGEHLISILEKYKYGRPLEWIVICRKM